VGGPNLPMVVPGGVGRKAGFVAKSRTETMRGGKAWGSTLKAQTWPSKIGSSVVELANASKQTLRNTGSKKVRRGKTRAKELSRVKGKGGSSELTMCKGAPKQISNSKRKRKFEKRER